MTDKQPVQVNQVQSFGYDEHKEAGLEPYPNDIVYSEEADEEDQEATQQYDQPACITGHVSKHCKHLKS